MKVCEVVGCKNSHRAKGLCPKHYWRLTHRGTIADPVKTSFEQRFWSKVDKTESCWVWKGALHDGYGTITIGYAQKMAHRASLEIAGVEVPADQFVDHVCRNRACVRPEHLRVVSPIVNAIENSHSPWALNRSKTQCKRGHPFDASNTYHVLEKGKLKRRCKECRRSAVRSRRRRVKSESMQSV